MSYNVFTATEIKKSEIANCVDPWYFELKFGDFIYPAYKQDDGYSLVGYKTKQKAEQAREKLLQEQPFRYKLVVLEKNADMSEGRGPMIFHRVYRNVEDAVNYILHANDFAGLCKIKIYLGINIHNELYAHQSFGNGMFNLRFVDAY